MSNYRELVEERLKFNLLPPGQFFDEVCAKKSICLHHTAGGGAEGSVAGWIADKSRVATPVLIQRGGTILQSYPSKFWAFSLGLTGKNYLEVEKQTIAIEICSYGWLKKVGDKYFTAYNTEISADRVYDHGSLFRGFRYFEKYTDAQIESVRRLMLYWGEKYGISLKYNPNMWQLNQQALAGVGGVWTHVAYRNDKSDCFPQPELVEMLKSLQP